MGSRKLTAVIDSGPIIHLTEIDCISILSIFDDIHVPDAVWEETVESRRTPREDLLRLTNLNRHTIKRNDITHFIEENN